MKKKMQIIICFYQSETGNEKKERNVCHETPFAGLWMILIRAGFMDAHKLLCGAIL